MLRGLLVGSLLLAAGCDEEPSTPPRTPCEELADEYRAALATAPTDCARDADCRHFIEIPGLELAQEGTMGQRGPRTCFARAVAEDPAPYRRLMDRARQLGCVRIPTMPPGGNARCDDDDWVAHCDETRRCRTHTTSGY